MKTTKKERARLLQLIDTIDAYQEAVMVPGYILSRLVSDADEAEMWQERYMDLWQAMTDARVALDGPWLKPEPES